MEEKQLIEALQRGEAAAYRWLVTAYHGQLYNVCLNFLGNVQDAEDMCQEVFVEVYRSVATFRGDARLSTWLYRIAVTKSLELLRHRKRRKRAASLLSLFGLGELGLEPHADRFDHPGVRLEHKEDAALLFAAISALPEQQRIAFTLHKVEDKSYQETAEIMGITATAVDSLVFRARANLKKRLSRHAGAPP